MEQVSPTSEPAEEVICQDSLRPRRLHSQNIVSRLLDRAMGQWYPGAHLNLSRELYQNCVPNMSVVNVEKPAGFLRKFSPDGKYLIAFSYDQTTLQIYNYRGCFAAGDLGHTCQEEVVTPGWSPYADYIRSSIFDRLFKLHHAVNLSPGTEQLNRECSLFTNDSRYVIVGGAVAIADDNRPSFVEIHSSNEALAIPVTTLDDYTIYMVDMHEGRKTAQIHFKTDKIFLSHNQGLYLYNNTLAILSVQHQTIHIYEISNGSFIPNLRLGRFCREDDCMLVHSVQQGLRPFRERLLGNLKQRILVFLFKQAHDQAPHISRVAVRRFYQFFDSFADLKMWKMQLLDENHLLIKYSSAEVAALAVPEPNLQPSYFVTYNIWDCKVLAVYENTSEKFLRVFENYCDYFRNTRLHYDMQMLCSPSNSVSANLLQHKYRNNMVVARGGGQTEATKRILAQLPLSAQSFSCSPYLDMSLFTYDDRWISALERPKNSGEFPIRFFARDSGLLRFRIFPGLQNRSIVASDKRLVAFTFHPIEPFAISVQRVNNDYIVNFHIRNCPS